MNFSKSQYEALAPFEEKFRIMRDAHYCRRLPKSEVETLWEIRRAATGNSQKVNGNCANCVMELVKEMSRMWFEDKEAYIALRNESAAAELTRSRSRRKAK